MKQQSTYFYDHIPVCYEMDEIQRQQVLEKYPPPFLMEQKEAFTLEHEVHGNTVKARLLLNDFSIEKTKTDKYYFKMRFSNTSGIINAKMWDNQGQLEAYKELLETHSVFDVKGKVEDYKGFKSISLHQLIPCDSDVVDPTTLLACTQHNTEELTIELFSYINELTPPYRDIAEAALTRFWDQFCIRPAAMGYHHNYLGGLLKHTVGLMRFARYILKWEDDPFKAVLKLIQKVEKALKDELWLNLNSDTPGGNSKQIVWKDTPDHLYNMFFGMAKHKEKIPQYDIVMTSILFHDIGKLLEYDHAGKQFEEFSFLFPTADHSSLNNRKPTGIIMDELGVMIGHIPFGVMMLTKIIEIENIQLSLEDIHHISHCILCHHGLPEWGACIRNPQTMEGYIVHLTDFLDSRYENTVNQK